MMLSSPKPISETDPAIAPATIETSPSRLLYPMVKYSSRCRHDNDRYRYGLLTLPCPSKVPRDGKRVYQGAPG